MKKNMLWQYTAGMNPALVLVIALMSVVFLTGCATHGQTGALTGALAGAAVGGMIGPDPTARTLNAIIGAGVGMFAGAAVGEQMDRQEMYNNEYYRNYGYKYDSQYGWYKDPYWQGPPSPQGEHIVIGY